MNQDRSITRESTLGIVFAILALVGGILSLALALGDDDPEPEPAQVSELAAVSPTVTALEYAPEPTTVPEPAPTAEPAPATPEPTPEPTPARPDYTPTVTSSTAWAVQQCLDQHWMLRNLTVDLEAVPHDFTTEVLDTCQVALDILTEDHPESDAWAILLSAQLRVSSVTLTALEDNPEVCGPVFCYWGNVDVYSLEYVPQPLLIGARAVDPPAALVVLPSAPPSVTVLGLTVEGGQ